MSTTESIRRQGPLTNHDAPVDVGTQEGLPLFELRGWRCTDCGMSLFFEDGTCSVCNCRDRIPQAVDRSPDSDVPEQTSGPNGDLRSADAGPKSIGEQDGLPVFEDMSCRCKSCGQSLFENGMCAVCGGTDRIEAPGTGGSDADDPDAGEGGPDSEAINRALDIYGEEI